MTTPRLLNTFSHIASLVMLREQMGGGKKPYVFLHSFTSLASFSYPQPYSHSMLLRLSTTDVAHHRAPMLHSRTTPS